MDFMGSVIDCDIKCYFCGNRWASLFGCANKQCALFLRKKPKHCAENHLIDFPGFWRYNETEGRKPLESKLGYCLVWKRDPRIVVFEHGNDIFFSCHYKHNVFINERSADYDGDYCGYENATKPINSVI